MSELADFRLSKAARRTLAALAPIVLTEEVDELGIRDEVVDGVELFLRSIPVAVRVAILAGIVTFEATARAVPSSLGRGFSRLPPELAAAHFARYWHSPLGALKQLARGMKMFLVMSYYEHPTKLAQLEYHPDRWIAQVAQERLERFAEEIREHEAQVTAPLPLPADVPRALPLAGGGQS
ncbi:MAG: hypothetical protein JKY65_14985 [Planctomycetes bacterium]|nr:hypothetical protein [Planctomycetota bacterium]